MMREVSRLSAAASDFILPASIKMSSSHPVESDNGNGDNLIALGQRELKAWSASGFNVQLQAGGVPQNAFP